MKLEFEKRHPTNGTEFFYIHVDIAAVSKDAKKIAYAVQNMAYSIGYRLTKKEEN